MDRLYYHDSYLTQFDAQAVSVSEDGLRVVLDRSAFYPSSGGQPHDLGILGGIPLADVLDDESAVVHVLSAPAAFVSGYRVTGVIDWSRRRDHMEQHTGQHLLSAVLAEEFGIATLSFHLGPEVSTVDVDATALPDVVRRVNERIRENRAVSVSYEDAASAQGLRKPSERPGILRIVTIDGLDRSACGGTHVRATGEIGALLLRKTEKVRNSLRIEFVCGGRALAQAHADYDALSRAARSFSSPLADVPGLVAAMQERLADADKSRRKLALTLAELEGRALHAGTPGGRWVWEVPEINDEVKAKANAFAGQGSAQVLVLCASSRAAFYAVSADAGVHAGKALQPLLVELGGKGGGGPLNAQGSVGDVAAFALLRERLGFLKVDAS